MIACGARRPELRTVSAGPYSASDYYSLARTERAAVGMRRGCNIKTITRSTGDNP